MITIIKRNELITKLEEEVKQQLFKNSIIDNDEEFKKIHNEAEAFFNILQSGDVGPNYCLIENYRKIIDNPLFNSYFRIYSVLKEETTLYAIPSFFTLKDIAETADPFFRNLLNTYFMEESTYYHRKWIYLCNLIDLKEAFTRAEEEGPKNQTFFEAPTKKSELDSNPDLEYIWGGCYYNKKKRVIDFVYQKRTDKVFKVDFIPSVTSSLIDVFIEGETGPMEKIGSISSDYKFYRPSALNGRYFLEGISTSMEKIKQRTQAEAQYEEIEWRDFD